VLLQRCTYGLIVGIGSPDLLNLRRDRGVVLGTVVTAGRAEKFPVWVQPCRIMPSSSIWTGLSRMLA